MDVVQSLDYLSEKNVAIKFGDQEDSAATGMRQFLDEKRYKPAHEAFKLGTMLKP